MRAVRATHTALAAGGFLALALLPCARADTVTLDNGKSLEGHVIDNGDTIVIELAQGTVRLPKARVRAITYKVTAQDEFRERVAGIRADLENDKLTASQAAERFFALAQWAGDNGLLRARTEALKMALDADPEHAGARGASGFVLQDGRWITKAERNQALGFVLYEGQWVPAEAAREAEEAKDAARQKQLGADRAEADQRVKEAQAGKLEAERDLLDAQREQLQDQRDWRWRYGRAYSSPWFACDSISLGSGCLSSYSQYRPSVVLPKVYRVEAKPSPNVGSGYTSAGKPSTSPGQRPSTPNKITPVLGR